jgi:L-cysteate sulfo-lyase
MKDVAFTADELRRRADRLPRVPLGHLPTPFEELPRFAARIGDVRVFVKRDDCTGLLFGGNKVRHAEFLLGDAVSQGADVIVWGAGIQSNNCRVTAAACARLGLECRLFLSRSTHTPEVQGNLLLDHLVGAKVELVDAKMGPELNAVFEAKAAELKAAGRKPYRWDPARTLPRGAVSYVLAAAELADDVDRAGISPAAIYVSSSGSTGAGLALGVKALRRPWPVRSVGYIRWPWDVPTEMARCVNDAAELLDLPHRFTPGDIDYSDEQIGADYGRLSPAGHEAAHILASSEALLLDPVYTARAVAQLIADVRSGKVPSGSAVVFVHTGGTPAVFAYAEEMLG